jgi:integrase
MSKPQYQEQVRGALSEAELLAMFTGDWPSPQDRAICALAFWAGLRRSEIFALRWDEVDMEGKRLVISRAVKRFGRDKEEVGTTKGRKVRIVPLVEEVAEALKPLPHSSALVIMRADGSAPNPRDWRTTMERAFKRAGIDTKGRNVTPHSSRHSIASILLARGVPKEVIKAILGHFDERTTDGYLHIAAEEIDKATAKLEKKAP